MACGKLNPKPLSLAVIVGMGETAMDFAKKVWAEGQYWRRKNGELWGINAAGYTFRCDKVFSIHDEEHLNDPSVPENFMRDLPEVPVVTAEPINGIQNNLIYPLGDVVQAFKTKNFLNTTAYMIAYALLCGVDVIELFGTEFNYYGTHEEEERERHCIRYWIGRAEERGCQIRLPFNSKLGNDTFYGFTTQPNFDMDLLWPQTSQSSTT